MISIIGIWDVGSMPMKGLVIRAACASSLIPCMEKRTGMGSSDIYIGCYRHKDVERCPIGAVAQLVYTCILGFPHSR